MLKKSMQNAFQRNSRLSQFLWLVVLVCVIAAMVASASHIHPEKQLAHDHCSMCQLASGLIAVCVAVVAILLGLTVSLQSSVEKHIRLALWKPSVPQVRPPPPFLFV